MRPKADEYSQVNLPHGTKQKRVMKKLKTKSIEMLRRNAVQS